VDDKAVFGKFSEFFLDSTGQLTIWLEDVLSTIDKDSWWKTLVLPELSYQQKQRVDRKNITRLQMLDLAALLRILDRNWYQISQLKRLSSRERNFVKEMQTIRNRWAHSDMDGSDNDDVYRDLDTLQRFVSMIGTSDELISDIKYFKKTVLLQDVSPQETSIQQETKSVRDTSVSSAKQEGVISVGSVVELKSNPTKQGAVVELAGNSPDSRCMVFLDGKLQHFYLTQLSSVV